MSKQGKRKITVELPKSKDLSNRPSVFERLGTKKSSSVKKTSEHCRQWAQHGTCAYGKSCKFAATHILISPSKQRAANKDIEQKRVRDDSKNRLLSAVVVRSGGRSPDGEIDNWDQNDLEYADTDVLEKRRQQLQRELELQLKMDSNKDTRKEKERKKAVSSSSSSRSSSSSSGTSSSTDGSSSSSSSDRDARRKTKKGKLKRNSSTSSDGEAPSKKKFMKSDSIKRDKGEIKKPIVKKDDKNRKHDVKKKLTKVTLGKKSLSPGKKSGGTPPIISKSGNKSSVKHGKSPVRRERKSLSPLSNKDRDKDRPKDRDKDREKDRDKDRDRNRARSRSPRKGRSRSPRRHSLNSKDARRKDSMERSRLTSPKKLVRKDDKKRSVSRARDHKDRSLERRKEEKERHDRKDRVRERNKDTKRDDSKRRGRDRGLGRGGNNKGLEKPNKPMERLLPRPEERLAALAAISNRTLESDKNSTTSKDRQDSERGDHKQDRERDRSTKRDRMNSMDRDPDYEIGMARPYDHGRNVEHYERGDERYDEGPRDDDRSPGYMQRERHYDGGYDLAGPPRGYTEDENMYGYEERRRHDRAWEGRAGSMDRERGYMHPHKEWDNEDYRAGGDWPRDRHWPIHDSQRPEWADKEPEPDGWHHRAPPRGRPPHDEFARGMRMDGNRGDSSKRRPQRTETETAPPKESPVPAAPPQNKTDNDTEDKPIPDDLSEISDDPDDILNREDMGEHNVDEDSQQAQPADESSSKPEGSENQSTQDTSGPVDEKEEVKDEEENTNPDFEEISDGELEEERTRAGLGDALGVDWASLVADVRRREAATRPAPAPHRWRPAAVLARAGLSLRLAGEQTVADILRDNAVESEPVPDANETDDKPEQNGKHQDEKPAAPEIDSLHPVAAIQVAIHKRKQQRAVLFGSGCEITRALSARRDLALRRHLCRLPAVERAPHTRTVPSSDLFNAARALLLGAPVKG